jgi:hypothetical protein
MWKALIKLVEKWSYRCDHTWTQLYQTNVLDREMFKKGIEVNSHTKYVYICEKCLEHKKIE